MDYDPGRGGYGSILKNELTSRQQMMAALTDEMNAGDVGGYQAQRPSEKRFRRDDSDDER